MLGIRFTRPDESSRMSSEHASKTTNEPIRKQPNTQSGGEGQIELATAQTNVLNLQRMVGNRKVQRMMEDRGLVLNTGNRERSLQRDAYHGGRMLSEGARDRWTIQDREMLRGVVGRGGIISGRQATRVPFFVTMLNDTDYQRFRQLLESAASDVHRGYICKALTQISNYTMDQLESFATTINAMDEAQLAQRMNVVDMQGAISPTDAGTPGITQQFNNACVVTSAQADRAQDDPIYALSLTASTVSQSPRQAVTRSDSLQNPAMADEQYEMLTEQGAIPSDRSVSMPGLNNAAYERVVSSRSSTTGLTADMTPIGDDFTIQRALEVIRSSVESGIRVYIRIGVFGGGGHAVLVIGYDAASDTYRIHDPWAGRTLARTGQQITTNHINIAGWNQLTHVLVPESAGLPEAQPRQATPAP